MLTLWGRKTSVNVQKPMWLIGELQLEHERKDVGGPFGGLDTPEYGAMNPHRLVPTLQDGDITVWESEAVLRYLSSQYGKQYFPDAIATHALIDQWMSWVQSTWSPAMTNAFISYVRVPSQERDASALAVQVDKLNALATLVDGLLETRDFLAGESLSVADMSFGSFLYRYYTLEITRPDCPALHSYYEKLCQRPAYVEHVHIDYDGMRVPGAERPST